MAAQHAALPQRGRQVHLHADDDVCGTESDAGRAARRDDNVRLDGHGPPVEAAAAVCPDACLAAVDKIRALAADQHILFEGAVLKRPLM